MLEKEQKERFFIEELKIIQDIIKRMAFDSFMIKGWAITLVIITLLLKGGSFQVFISFIPLLVFWYLDAYFLWQERMYRELYNWVVKNRLKTEDFLFDLNAYRFKDKVQGKLRIMFSITLGWFYGSIAVLILVYAFFILKWGI
ncbi:hypothetical protein DK28_0207920 [Peptococcaceae bacterium SCADC1_2_3]|jgi:hypothetical protein|nr:hypothetical protein DK28_0207920 [Peptococcaceae bacterium SCADC1_2_3]KFI36252.1 hypothetical protein HY00_04085 [Peptococcaceae bacterium SCADC1_2_3]